MIRSYLASALRGISRNRVYFSINLTGLTVGITCCILLIFFVRFELSYDQFHEKKDRLYRVNYDVVMGGNQTISPSVPVFVGPQLKQKFSAVEDATRILFGYQPRTLSIGDKMFEERDFVFADPSFFRLLDFKAISGDLTTALAKPNTVVITRSMAKKYFADQDPMGKVITSNNADHYEITGIIENVPSNSHFTFDFISSICSLKGIDDNTIQWNNPNYTTFLLLKPDTDVAALQDQINEWVSPRAERDPSANSLLLPLEPLAGVHFNTTVFNFQNRLVITDITYVYIFMAIALLVLLIGCINYINLSTARASLRAKEVGIRKTSGAFRRQLVFQFLMESSLVLLPAVVLSVVAAWLLLPMLNFLVGKEIAADFTSPVFVGTVISGYIVISLLSGFYPSLVLSGFKPSSVLKGKTVSVSSVSLRKSLVVFQFTISIVLIVGALVVFSQLQFMQSKKLGLDKEAVVMIRGNSELYPKLNGFIDELKKLPGIEQACGTWRSPFETVVGNGFNLSPNPGNDGWVVVGGIAGDQDYLATMGIELISGRNFDPTRVRDTVNEFLVNEAFLRDFGLTAEEAIGKSVTLGIVANRGPGTIVGVMKDFHIASLHEVIRPVMVFNSPDFISGAAIRLSAGDARATLGKAEQVWRRFVSSRPFNFTFLNDQYDALYRTEQRISGVTGIFAGIAIFIACLGLLALASFTSLQRSKEISIRKVLGATSESIMMLLSKGYLKLVLVAFIISVPLSYYLLNLWLQNFAFKVTVGPLFYAGAFGFLLMVSWVTIGFQSYKASTDNPVNNLRRE
jgi:putative ABC transport system permease protein